MASARSRTGAGWSLAVALAALSGVGLTSRCQQAPTVHGLTDDSSWAGCALCPVVPDDLGGSFRLVEVLRPADSEDSGGVEESDDGRLFVVEDVYWVVGGGSGDTPVTGSGSYWIVFGERGERLHRMQLTLRIGDADPRRFDSGLVPAPLDGPGIEIRLRDDPPEGAGALVYLRTIPFAATPRTPCGPEQSCDARAAFPHQGRTGS